MHKKIPYKIADRLTKEWSPAMRMIARDVVTDLRRARTLKEWRGVVEAFELWVQENRDVQF